MNTAEVKLIGEISFRDIKVIPTFFTVSQLRHSLEKWIMDPSSFIPEEDVRTEVIKKCFYNGDGKSSKRIADTIICLISAQTIPLTTGLDNVNKN